MSKFKPGDRVVYRFDPRDIWNEPRRATVVAVNNDRPTSGTVWVHFDTGPINTPPYTEAELTLEAEADEEYNDEVNVGIRAFRNKRMKD